MKSLIALDLADSFATTPPPLDYVWPGFVTGTVGALVAPGGVRKSFWALQASMAVASEDPAADLLSVRPAKHGRVVYIAAEDPAPVLHQRVHAIGSLIPPAARASIAGHLELMPAMGAGIDVMQEADLTELVRMGAGARLIVLDTLSRMHRADENDNGQAAGVISQLERLAVETGAAVLYVHHAGKIAVREGFLDQQQAARGASAFVDNARWTAYVRAMTKKEGAAMQAADGVIGDRYGAFLAFGVPKHNYSPELAQSWCRRQKGSVLKAVEIGAKAGTASAAKQPERQRHAI